MIARLLTLLLAAGVLFACGPDWREYRSEEGKYAIEFPGTRTVERRASAADALNMVQVQVDSSTAYAVSWYTAYAARWYEAAKPVKRPADLLKEIEAKVLAGINAGPAQSSEIKLDDGVPGRAFVARSAKGLDVAVRVYAVGAGPIRVYQLTAAVPDAKRAEADIKRFFESFKLTR